MNIKKIFFIAVLAKIIFYLDVVLRRLWHMGDSGHYMHWAQNVCNGELAGDPVRMPLYSWFLSVTSACQIWRGQEDMSGGGVAGPLFFQVLITLLSAAFLYRAYKSKLQGKDMTALLCLWLFDPVLFTYSNFIMADVLFAVNILFTSVYFYRFISDSSSLKNTLLFALFFTLSMFTRAAVLPLGFLTFLAIAIGCLFGTVNFKRAALVFTIVSAFLIPRLVSIQKRTGELSLATQGSSWSLAVAGVVDYHERGLGFHEAEIQWSNDHPHATSKDAVNVILSKWKTWAWLTAKGVARVFFGHVNVEATRLVTGKTVIGPGLLKKSEGGEGAAISGLASMIPWIAGMLVTLLYTSWFYLLIAKTVKKHFKGSPVAMKVFTGWAIAVTLVMAILPQVYGDSRFRLGYWPVLLVLFATLKAAENQKA